MFSHSKPSTRLYLRSLDLERLRDLEKDLEGLWFLSREGDLSLLRSLETDLLRLLLKLLLRGDRRRAGGLPRRLR